MWQAGLSIFPRVSKSLMCPFLSTVCVFRLFFCCVVGLTISELLIYWGNDLSRYYSYFLILSLTTVYGVSNYVDFYLIWAYVNLVVFHWLTPSKVFLIPRWLNILFIFSVTLFSFYTFKHLIPPESISV